MKNQLSKYRYGNKGIVFTLDVLVALTIFMIIASISIYYASQASENKIGKIQMANAASDFLAVIDNNETLKTLNQETIQNEINLLLVPPYKMRILIETQNNELIDIGNVTPEGSLVTSGKRYFFTGSEYAEANYWIWAEA